MRIVFLCQQWPPVLWNGLGTYTYNVARALAARGHEVHVIACVAGQASSDELDDGVHVHRRPLLLPSTRHLRRLPVLGLIWRAIERAARGANHPDDRLLLRADLAVSNLRWYRHLGLRADVVEAQESDGHALLFTFRRQRPAVVVQLHGPAMLRARLWGRMRVRGRIADAVDRLTARRADALACSSALMVQTLRESGWLPSDRPVAVIPNAYTGTIDRSGGGVTPPIVLAVGRIEPTKSPELLVRAAAELRDQVPALEVHFVGGRPASRAGRRFADEVEALARRLGSPCRFWGALPREEVLARYRGARVVAVPSRLDNFPNVVLEAMAAGRPVVCSTGVGLADLVGEAGAGSVFPAGDARALASTLLPYLTDPGLADAAGRRGQELVVSRLSPAVTAAAREALYEEALRRRDACSGP